MRFDCLYDSRYSIRLSVAGLAGQYFLIVSDNIFVVAILKIPQGLLSALPRTGANQLLANIRQWSEVYGEMSCQRKVQK